MAKMTFFNKGDNLVVRLRFAPSPTGNLHIGTLRTALFNWLYAKAQKGVFILRIEDTDLQRSKSEYEDNIVEGLKWLGMSYEEGPAVGGEYGPYRQKERIVSGIYKKALDELLDKGYAYYCFCTESELNEEREAAKKANKPYVYSRKCYGLSKNEVAEKLKQNLAYTIRFKMPDEDILFQDIIRNDINFDCRLVSDFVIMKSDGSPSYNFACVVDDIDMKITHVVRGEDHISNMPKQLALFAAFGAMPPQYAHMPMILGADRSKLSKRHGATSVTEYRDQGFLPDAFINYLSLLGWSPKDEQELLSVSEIIEQFSLERISKAGAIFDVKKLTWMNGQYIRKMNKDTYFQFVWPFVDQDLKANLEENYSIESLKNLLFSVRDNLDLVSEISTYIKVYVDSDDVFREKVASFDFSDSDLQVIRLFYNYLKNVESLSVDSVEYGLTSILEQTGFGKGKVFRPLRIACTGEKSGPHVAEILSILGKEKLLRRLEIQL